MSTIHIAASNSVPQDGSSEENSRNIKSPKECLKERIDQGAGASKNTEDLRGITLKPFGDDHGEAVHARMDTIHGTNKTRQDDAGKMKTQTELAVIHELGAGPEIQGATVGREQADRFFGRLFSKEGKLQEISSKLFTMKREVEDVGHKKLGTVAEKVVKHRRSVGQAVQHQQTAGTEPRAGIVGGTAHICGDPISKAALAMSMQKNTAGTSPKAAELQSHLKKWRY